MRLAPGFFWIVFITFTGSAFISAQATEPPPMNGDAIVLDSIEVGPSYNIANLGDLIKAKAKYEALPQSVRDVIGFRFYLVERKSRKILVGPALEKLHLQLITEDGQDLPLIVDRDGQVDIPLPDQKLRGHIVANMPKNKADVGFRLFIRVAPDKPLTLGYMRSAADTFLTAYKPYAGMVFRTFIGDRKPNCFGMGFFEPQQVQVLLPGAPKPIWSSQPSTRVTVFFSDIPTTDRNARISWTGNSAPYFTTACLMNREE